MSRMILEAVRRAAPDKTTAELNFGIAVEAGKPFGDGRPHIGRVYSKAGGELSLKGGEDQGRHSAGMGTQVKREDDEGKEFDNGEQRQG